MSRIRFGAALLVTIACCLTPALGASKPNTRAAKGKKVKPVFAHRIEEHRPGRGRKLKQAPNAPRVIEVFKDSDAWSGEAREAATLAAMGKVVGIDHFVHPMSELADGISPNADVVLLTSNGVGDPQTSARQNLVASQSNLDAFVRRGGVLVIDAGDNDGSGGYVAPGAVGTPALVFPEPGDDATLTSAAAGPDRTLGTEDDHRLIRGPDGSAGTLDDLTNTNIDMCCYVAHGNLTDGFTLPPTATVLMTATFGEPRPIVAEYCLGSGRVIVDTVTKEFGGHEPEGTGPSYFLQALLAYALDPIEHVPCQVSGLREDVSRMATAKIRARLDARLSAVGRHFAHRNAKAACGQLRAFANNVRAERKKRLTAPVADEWLRKSQAIGVAINCSL